MKTHKGWFIGESAAVEARMKAMRDELVTYVELCCKAAEKAFKDGHTLRGIDWNEKAQNARRVLVDLEVLPPSTL